MATGKVSPIRVKVLATGWLVLGSAFVLLGILGLGSYETSPDPGVTLAILLILFVTALLALVNAFPLFLRPEEGRWMTLVLSLPAVWFGGWVLLPFGKHMLERPTELPWQILLVVSATLWGLYGLWVTLLAWPK